MASRIDDLRPSPRPATPGAPVAVLASTNTWNAYNNFGGRSNYINADHLPERAADLLLPLDQQLDADGRLPVPGTERTDVDEDVRLRVSHLAETDQVNTRFAQHVVYAFEQVRLHVRRHLADLVEEKRAAVGLLEAPDALLVGARERPLFMPEEL